MWLTAAACNTSIRGSWSVRPSTRNYPIITRPVTSLVGNTYSRCQSYNRSGRFLARDAFVERIIALLLWCSSVCPSVHLSGTGAHCDRTVHFSADLSLRLDSPIFWAPWHQSISSYSQPSFPVPPEREVGYRCAN